MGGDKEAWGMEKELKTNLKGADYSSQHYGRQKKKVKKKINIQLLPKKNKKKTKKKRNIAWIKHTRSVEDICAEDNYNQRLWLEGKISPEEFKRRARKTEKEWDDMI